MHKINNKKFAKAKNYAQQKHSKAKSQQSEKLANQKVSKAKV